MKNKKKIEESKKVNIWFCIAVLICIIILAIIFHIVRNMYYFAEINKKTEPYLSKTNVYKKIEDKYLVSEEWLLDDMYMFKVTNKVINATTIDITKDGVRTSYENVDGQKTKEKKRVDKIYPIVDDLVNFSNPFDRIMTAFFNRVRIVEEDGKKLYKVSGKRNSNFMYNNDCIFLDLYLDYETGFLYKLSEAIRTENAKVDYVDAIYTLEFDKNTEDMFKVENESEYQENKVMEENV